MSLSLGGAVATSATLPFVSTSATLPRWRPARPVGVPDGMSKINRSFQNADVIPNPPSNRKREFWDVEFLAWPLRAPTFSGDGPRIFASFV